MLYLEDYLEMIEHLPQELRDRFTEMREMDLQVHNASDSVEERVKTFFMNAKKMKQAERDAEFEAIQKDYYKALEDADEKIHLANQMYDLVDRYLRRLDQELYKFKVELEADSKGITEILEKRSLELDQPQPSSSSQKENRYSFSLPREKKQSSSGNPMEKKNTVEKVVQERQQPATVTTNPNVAYSLGHIGVGGNAIAAAASQAIAATQQMQQGRRTASLKASYEAINMGLHTHEFSIGRELAGVAQSALAATQETTKKQKKKSSSSAPPPPPPPVDPSPPPPEDIIPDAPVDPTTENPDWTYDPNEPRYCICNQVSYGDMVACDNEDCPFEWFHYPCVGITAPPKGKWYCPQCASAMKRRGSRK